MLSFLRRKRIIKKAVNNTVASFSSRTPIIYEYFFYGAFDIAPQNLVVWYLFKTDEELEIAETSGFCKELRELTIKNLIELGYPNEAFEATKTGSFEFNDDKVKKEQDSEDYQETILQSLAYRKAMISFASQEDIERKTNGDYHLYFQ